MYISVLLHSFEFTTITTPNNKLNPITLGHLPLRVRNGCFYPGAINLRACRPSSKPGTSKNLQILATSHPAHLGLTSCRVIPYHQLTCPAFCSRNKHHGPMPGLCGESGGGPAAPPPGASPRRPEGNAAVWGGGAWGQSLQSGPPH